ncbi:MAG: hypothetical protein HZB13_20000 [Acidobacteria bacterium]|nr:hypothetical protein [Acidobacteriota bacterium]
MRRRDFFASPVLAAVPVPKPVTAEVRTWNGKPTLHINGKPVYASFYALTDCPGGRWSWEEKPQSHIAEFAACGFRLFQLDLFLESLWTKEGPLDITFARKQLQGILQVCPDAAIVLRWHLNAPAWWTRQRSEELVRYDNGELERVERDTAQRTLMDDLRRTPRVSLASRAWKEMATQKTVELLRGLAAVPEGHALAGIHVACGVYGEWHYWGFMRNTPDMSAPMQAHFDDWRKERGRAPVRVPSEADRKALDDGIFRDPRRSEPVIDYFKCQQELVADQVLHFCGLVRKHFPRRILTGTFYGYFFSMFDRQATGGHLCPQKVLAYPDVDYLSAPQAYGTEYRGAGSCGITRALVESVRLHGKLFLDEMDQTPSWQYQNDVDTAFKLSDLDLDYALLRRNVVESFARGSGLWYYDFGPANLSGWWSDRRLLAEVRRIKDLLEKYHLRPYQPAGDVLFVFDTEVYYYTGPDKATDPVTDSLAVNRTITSAWRSGVALETVHLGDIERVNLGRFKVVVFANTWLMSAAQRKFIRERVVPGRTVVFQGQAGYCDGTRLSAEFVRELTAPAAEGRVRHYAGPIGEPAVWREIFREAGAHIYIEGDAVVHAGGGLVLVHTKEGGVRKISFRGGRTATLELPPKSSWIFDAATGERVL